MHFVESSSRLRGTTTVITIGPGGGGSIVTGVNLLTMSSNSLGSGSGQAAGPLNPGLTRHAVSLAQLPPPIEAELDTEDTLVVPPPPEFTAATPSGATHGDEIPLVIYPS